MASPHVRRAEFASEAPKPIRPFYSSMDAASKVHLASMRVMLEAHYDDFYLERYNESRLQAERKVLIFYYTYSACS